MTRVLAALLASAAILALVPAAATAQQRPRWDTDVLALIQRPGYPAHAYVHPNGRVYAGTYTNPGGDTVPSRVFEFDDRGDLLRSWTVAGQDLSKAHGVQAATSDAQGRLVLLDKAPARAVLLDLRTGDQTEYARFPGDAIPNYAAWGPDGSLYVTDYGQPIIWRIPKDGGTPEPWLQDPRLDGGDFGTTGIELRADRSTLLITVQSQAGGAGGNPTTGRLFELPINPDGKPGALRQLWESNPGDGPDGFGIAQSGRIYIANLVSNQLVVVAPDGREVERFPRQPLSGENGSPVPFDSPSNASFLGTRVMVAQQSFFAGDPKRQAILDVEVGEPGLPELIPGAPPGANPPPQLTGVRLDRRNLRFTLDEDARVRTVTERQIGSRWQRVRVRAWQRPAGSHRISLRALADAKRALKPGLWRVSLTARDAALNVSDRQTRTVRIRRARR